MIISVSCTIIVAMITIMDRVWDPVRQQNNKIDKVIEMLENFKKEEEKRHTDFDKRLETLEIGAWNAHPEYQWFLNRPSRVRGTNSSTMK